MKIEFKDEVKLFMIFDILGDIVRSGPIEWCVDRKRLEDVKDHEFDLIIIFKILRRYLPTNIDDNKVIDYMIVHDLPEAITGDITKFEGVPEEEKTRVNNLAIKYLTDKFNGILNFQTLFNNYENRVDIEAKVVKMIDKVHSSTTFIKYQSEKNIDTENPNIIPELRNIPFVDKGIKEGKDVADIFYEYHVKSVNITDEEVKKYNISREDADRIVTVIRAFFREFYQQKLERTLLDFKNDFPVEAMKYNRNI